MKYLGSKNKISKELAPIIQSYITNETVGYLEPFVGGANMIDKIQCDNKIGFDAHKQLIALLNKAKDEVDLIPSEISEIRYNDVKENRDKFEDWYVGLVGFCATFASKYFGGYARDRKTGRNIPAESIRNLKKQAPYLRKIKFECKNFEDITEGDFEGFVIYCDIPYRNTTRYSTEEFPYTYFYEWVKVMSKKNTVLISEYQMPSEFTCIWEKEVHTKVHFTPAFTNTKVEKLFTYKPNQ